MRIWLKIAGGIAVVVASFLVTDYALERWSPTCPAVEIELRRPFSKSGAFGYLKEGLPVAGDSPAGWTSKFLLCEDGRALGPAHSGHAEIGTAGKGRYSHWGNSVVFSTSDNSDPNVNGRAYGLAAGR